MDSPPLLLQHDMTKRAAALVVIPRDTEVWMQSAEFFTFTPKLCEFQSCSWKEYMVMRLEVIVDP